MTCTQITIRKKIAELEALENAIAYAERNRDCWMVETEDGCCVPPLIDDNDYGYNQYHAWDKIVSVLMKEVK